MEDISKISILKLALEKIASISVYEKFAGATGDGLHGIIEEKDWEILCEHLQGIAIDALKEMQN